jgi:hypothetical protein
LEGVVEVARFVELDLLFRARFRDHVAGMSAADALTRKRGGSC